MKKFFISIFAIFYLGLSSGLAFNVNFCMGKIASIDFYKNSEKNCGRCGMKQMKHCCDSKLTVAKISNSQQVSSAEINIKLPYTAIINYTRQSFVKPVAEILQPAFSSTSPPESSGAFLCILNSVFIL
jgi:hypothetical protein